MSVPGLRRAPRISAAGSSSARERGIPWLIPFLLLWGCAGGGNGEDRSGIVDVGGTWTEPLGVLYAGAWPGNGLGLTVRIADPDGGTAGGGLVLRDATGAPLPFSAQPAEVASGFALVLFDEPSDAAERSVLRTRTAAFLRSLGSGIRVALYRRCTGVDQVAGFSEDRDFVADTLLDENPLCDESGRVGIAEAIAIAAGEAAAVDALAGPARRFVIFVSGGALDEPKEPISGAGDVQLYAVSGREELEKFAPYPRISAFGWSSASELDAAFGAVADRMALYARQLYTVGSCPGSDLASGFSLGLGNAAPVRLTPPSRPPEEASMPCEATRIAADERAYPDRIAFLMTAEQRAVFDADMAANQKTDFRLSIQLGDAAPVAARAHIHGHSAIRCRRKSFTVDLDGTYPRHLLPGAATDEFMLISMCFDEWYFEQYAVDLIAREIGLFPLHFGYAELVIDGQSAGVYLVIEKPDAALLAGNARVQTIVRRRFDANGEDPDIHFPDDADAHSPAIDSYNQLVEEASKRHGEELVAEMERRIDLDGYLRLIAYHSLMQNGDNSDETYFFSTEAVREGRIGDWYQVIGWDMDDLYSSCHYGGKFQIDDPHGLLYCAEGQLEQALLTDDVVYARFVEVLDDLITRLAPEERFRAVLAETVQRLLPYFDRPGICEAMTELVAEDPAAVAPEVAKADIQARMDGLLASFRARSDLLRARIDAFRQTRGIR